MSEPLLKHLKLILGNMKVLKNKIEAIEALDLLGLIVKSFHKTALALAEAFSYKIHHLVNLQRLKSSTLIRALKNLDNNIQAATEVLGRNHLYSELV